MIKLQGCPLFLLMLLLAGSYSVNGNVSKRGCLGDSIKIIENISYNSNDIVVSIYKNGDIKFILGMWHIQDGVPAIRNGQSDRLVLDKKGNIWILNLIISDEAKYTIKIDIGNSTNIYDVPLEVMAPPTKKCKPNIILAGNNLFAELKHDECGRPSASAYWLEHPGISISRQVIQLQHGNDNGIYHACIEGDSLICAKISNFSEHCSIYNKSEPKPMINQSVVDDSNPRILSGANNIPREFPESSTTTIIICVMVAICLLLQIAKTFYKRCPCVPETKNGQSLPGDSNLTNPPVVPEPQNCESLSGNSSPMKQTAGGGIGTPENEETEQNTVSVQGEAQPLLSHMNDDGSRPRSPFNTSTSEEEGNDTGYKELCTRDGDPPHMIQQRQSGSFNPKMAIGDSYHSISQCVPESFDRKTSKDQYLLKERGETVDNNPVQGIFPGYA
ncbi:hypothetical protein CHS0354_014889 [Potamilus streckersoni]|uniref:Ig-like domain-containing protein n=1 Tax=Potamilus streckersoni TaxID=2493646 RepID=A0AAE0RU50_9BIVA|nr:hypothetical protein CHS0354_014889 [Potamilus streckersoni]